MIISDVFSSDTGRISQEFDAAEDKLSGHFKGVVLQHPHGVSYKPLKAIRTVLPDKIWLKIGNRFVFNLKIVLINALV